ncbi:MAG TPA: hypothetical protein VHV30_11885 [Polyangiaceae bacterium]|jgi:hypothetical protein|nr:hypothetical protein [Polyangiaceae bacterium]
MSVRQWVGTGARVHLLALLGAMAPLAALQCSSSSDAPSDAPSTPDASMGSPSCSTTATTTTPPAGGMEGGAVGTPEAGATGEAGTAAPDGGVVDAVKASASALIDQGRQIFRYDTFGDEAFWGDALKLHEAIQGSAHDGGVGSGVSPKTALSVGLKVDVDALPPSVVTALQNNQVDLDSPDTTLTLLQANAVIGVTGVFDAANKNLTSIGIQCAVCHSTVDDSLAPGIGHRLDGWANRDLNVGAIINLAPDLSVPAAVLGVSESAVRTVLQSWGPGKFDAELFMDGQSVRPDNSTAATLIPPAFGLAGVNLHTWTGWGSVTYWNAFVANLEMHGKGTFYDPRLDDATKFPVAAKNNFGHVTSADDEITPKLAALHFYQLALVVPSPPAGSFDAAAAGRGQTVFNGPGKCATCHVPPLFTEPGWNMHTGAEIGIDEFQASRAPDGRYRTSPLKGLFSHAKGGYYHDGRFATLGDVVTHYNTALNLGLTAGQQSDLVAYLNSL